MKKKSPIILSLLLVMASIVVISAFSQPNEEWSRTFGGTKGDSGHSVQQTSDGGYIIVGRTLSFGAVNRDVYLVKTDSDGDKVWEKTFGGSGPDDCFSVQQTSDGGYIIAGCIWYFGAGKDDVYLVKTDSDGDLVWEKTFGGTESEGGFSVQQTSDGGYIVVGYTTSYGAGDVDVYLIKVAPEIPTIPTIKEAIDDINNEIGHKGIANSLTSKLQNALSALERGKTKSFINILNAFINEVEAQSGMHIDEDYANTLIEWAQTWIEYPAHAR